MRTLAIWMGTLVIGLSPAAAMEKGREMTMVDETEKIGLAKRMAAGSAETADLIGRPKTTVERFSTPFFSKGAVYEVRFITPSGPNAFTVGFANGDAPILLQNNPEGFFQLAERAQTSFPSESVKTAYGTTFLEATRDFRKRFQILQQASDIQIIAQPTAEEQTRYRELEDKYKTTIHAPRLSATSHELKVYALVGQDLVQISLTFEDHGHLKRSDKVLEKSLPIGYAK